MRADGTGGDGLMMKRAQNRGAIAVDLVRRIASDLGITAQRGTAQSGFYSARWVATHRGTAIATADDCEGNVLRRAIARIVLDSSCDGCPVHDTYVTDRGPRPEWLRADGRVEVYDRERGPCPVCSEPVEDHVRSIAGYRANVRDDRGSTIYALQLPCRMRSGVLKRRRLAELEAKAGAR